MLRKRFEDVQASQHSTVLFLQVVRKTHMVHTVHF